MKKCCICGKEFVGYGNNPYPVKESGVCCNECNYRAVLPVRLLKCVTNKIKGHEQRGNEFYVLLV